MLYMELEFLFLYQPRQGDKHNSWLVNKSTHSHQYVKVLLMASWGREIGKSRCGESVPWPTLSLFTSQFSVAVPLPVWGEVPTPTT